MENIKAKELFFLSDPARDRDECKKSIEFNVSEFQRMKIDIDNKTLSSI